MCWWAYSRTVDFSCEGCGKRMKAPKSDLLALRRVIKHRHKIVCSDCFLNEKLPTEIEFVDVCEDGR